MTGEEHDDLDRMLLALSREGFALPYGPAHIADFINGPTDPPPGPERDAAVARLRAADDAAWEENRAALRRVLDR